MKKGRQAFTLSPEVLEALRKLSEQTLIPQSRLVEKALKELLAAYKEA